MTPPPSGALVEPADEMEEDGGAPLVRLMVLVWFQGRLGLASAGQDYVSERMLDP
jgi:hypothetical protein